MLAKRKIVVVAEKEGSYWGYQRDKKKFGLGSLKNAYIENPHFCLSPTDMPHPSPHHLEILEGCKLVKVEILILYKVIKEEDPDGPED